MSHVYRPNPAAQWRYSRPRPFVPQYLAVEKSAFEQIYPWLVARTARHPWIYEIDPDVQWRYSRPRPFVPQNLAVEQAAFEQIYPWLVHRTARHPWIYEVDPDIQWHYHGRDYFIPLGKATGVAPTIEPPTGIATFEGKIPTIVTASDENLAKFPIQLWTLRQHGGVYRPQARVERRIFILPDPSPPDVGGVTISPPAGVFNFTGFAPMFDVNINVPLGLFSFTGLVPSFVGQVGDLKDFGPAVFAVFDSEEFDRVKREKAEIDAMLRTDLEAAVGPTKADIADAWTEALFFIDQNPGATVFVTHDIENADLAKLVTKIQSVGVLETSAMAGTVETPDSSVTFAKGEEGWIFFRAAGDAVN